MRILARPESRTHFAEANDQTRSANRVERARLRRNQKAFKPKDAKTLAPCLDHRQHLPREARRSQRTESPGGEFLKRRNALVLAARESTQDAMKLKVSTAGASNRRPERSCSFEDLTQGIVGLEWSARLLRRDDRRCDGAGENFGDSAGAKLGRLEIRFQQGVQRGIGLLPGVCLHHGGAIRRKRRFWRGRAVDAGTGAQGGGRCCGLALCTG